MFSSLLEAQEDWEPNYDTMNRWRSAFERAGVLVFQMQDVLWSEARGFSVFSDTLPLAVVNVKDAPNGRIFTMFHELSHLALQQGGICDLRETGGNRHAADAIEIFCNAVAGAVLVPREPLLRDGLVRGYPEGHEWQDGDLRRIAHKFRCSSEVVTRRLLAHHRITRDFYQRKENNSSTMLRPDRQSNRQAQSRLPGDHCEVRVFVCTGRPQQLLSKQHYRACLRSLRVPVCGKMVRRQE